MLPRLSLIIHDRRKITKKKQAAAAAARRREPQAVTKICFKSAAGNDVAGRGGAFDNQANGSKMVKLDKDAIKAIVKTTAAANSTAPPPALPMNGAAPDPASPDLALPFGTTSCHDRNPKQQAVPSDGDSGDSGGACCVTNGSSAATRDEDVDNVDSAAGDSCRLSNGHASVSLELDEGEAPEADDQDGHSEEIRLPVNGLTHTTNGVAGNHVVDDVEAEDILQQIAGGECGDAATLCLARLGGDGASDSGGEAEVAAAAGGATVADATVGVIGAECTSAPPPPPSPPAVQITNITILVNGVDIDAFESGAVVEPLDGDVIVAATQVEDDDDDEPQSPSPPPTPPPPPPPARASSNMVLKSYEEKLESRSRKSNKWQHPKSYHRYPKTKAAAVEDVDLADDEVENGEIPTPSLDAGGRVTEEFLLDLLRFFKHQRRLPSMTLRKLLREAKEYFVSQPSLVDIELGRDDVINICGDIHGQFYDLARQAIFAVFIWLHTQFCWSSWKLHTSQLYFQ